MLIYSGKGEGRKLRDKREFTNSKSRRESHWRVIMGQEGWVTQPPCWHLRAKIWKILQSFCLQAKAQSIYSSSGAQLLSRFWNKSTVPCGLSPTQRFSIIENPRSLYGRWSRLREFHMWQVRQREAPPRGQKGGGGHRILFLVYLSLTKTSRQTLKPFSAPKALAMSIVQATVRAGIGWQSTGRPEACCAFGP